jgi:hypothetical protein
MRSIDLAITTTAVLVFGGSTHHAQTWQKPPDNLRGPLKWGDAAIRTLSNMEEGYEKIFAVVNRRLHRHGKY